MIQYLLRCCDTIYTARQHATFKRCPRCDAENPMYELVDKEDWVITGLPGFSGDDKHEKRPWGSFTVLLDEKDVKVKKIVVKPNGKLSLQLHKHRKELWKIVSGSGRVQKGSEVFDVSTGDTVVIDKYDVHRVQCDGLIDLVIIEIQTGICKEDDIIRIEDEYNRK